MPERSWQEDGAESIDPVERRIDMPLAQAALIKPAIPPITPQNCSSTTVIEQTTATAVDEFGKGFLLEPIISRHLNQNDDSVQAVRP